MTESNVSKVRQLLRLFGFKEKRERVESLEKEKPELFESLLAQQSHYQEIHALGKTGKIFLITRKGKVEPLIDYEDVVFASNSGKSLASEVKPLYVKHNITGTSEHKLFSLIKQDHLELLDREKVMKDPIAFTHCIFLERSNKMAYIPVQQKGIDEILKPFRLSAVVCNDWKFRKGDHTEEKDRVKVLRKRTMDTLDLINRFLSSSSPTKKSSEKSPKSPKKEKKEKDKKVKKSKKPITESVPFLIKPLLPVVVVEKEKELFIIDRNTTDYNQAIEWLHACPSLIDQLISV